MSPNSDLTHSGPYSFPRVSGDEPKEKDNEHRHLQFSPRERG